MVPTKVGFLARETPPDVGLLLQKLAFWFHSHESPLNGKGEPGELLGQNPIKIWGFCVFPGNLDCERIQELLPLVLAYL